MLRDRSQEFSDELRQLVQADEIESSLEQLVAFLASSHRDLHNEAILLSSRLNRLRAKSRKGLVTDDDSTVQRNRIAASILDFIDEMVRCLKRSQLPFAFSPVEFSAPKEANLEAIVGNNNLKSIAWLEQGLAVSQAVCRVVTPAGLGTGFLIGDNRLITNHHVIPSDAVAAESVVEFNFQEDQNRRLQPVSQYPVSSRLIKSNPELDYCVAQIEESADDVPLASWGTLRLANGDTPAEQQHVTIVQHPKGGVKQIAITANQVVNVFEHRLQYTTDTLPGSSGSPVFNDDWQVVALHHAGGNLILNERGDRMYANQGILIGDILADVG